MYTGFRAGQRNRSTVNVFEYKDAVRFYAKQMPFHGPNGFLEDKLKLLRLNELTVNDRFALPYCHFGCAAIDSSENKFMICGASNGDVYVVDLDEAAMSKKTAIAVYKKQPVTRDGHKNRVIGCEWFKNDASSFITCSRDNTVKLWDTANFEIVDTYKMGYKEHSVAQIDWSGVDPYLIAVALNSSVVKFVDSGIGSAVQQIKWKSKHISCVRWYPSNGYYVFVGTTEGAAGFFDIRQSKMPIFELRDRKYSAFDSRVERAKFTKDGTKIIAMSADLTLKGFNMDNGEIIVKKMPGVGPRKPTSPIFDLCEEAGYLYALIPCKRKVKLMRLEGMKTIDVKFIDDFNDMVDDNTPTKPLDKLLNFEIGQDLLLDGFLGDAMGAVYRNGKQHVVGYGTTESALIFTPKCDILTIEDRAGPKPEDLHVDDWSSDDDL